MREIAGMVPVITHAVTNRLLLVRHMIYVLQKRRFELGIVFGFPDPKWGVPFLSHCSVQQQHTRGSLSEKFLSVKLRS